eukprot:690537-Rhodomonas_salina.2
MPTRQPTQHTALGQYRTSHSTTPVLHFNALELSTGQPVATLCGQYYGERRADRDCTGRVENAFDLTVPMFSAMVRLSSMLSPCQPYASSVPDIA